ncbi:MAG: hypothetical protein V1706_03415 [Pseudomonadota bacterium]
MTLFEFCLPFIIFFFFLYMVLRLKGISHWFLPYLGHQLKNFFTPSEFPQNIYFCIVDHFEPKFDSVVPMSALNEWCHRWPTIAERHSDWRGVHPKHTFFLPIEQYNGEAWRLLAEMCHKGYGDVEIHLHHNDDSSENLMRVLQNKKELMFLRHGFLRKDPVTKDIVFSFIHGNWCLDNSRSDGKWCGVNNEIDILRECGCYADLTMPSGTGSTQTKTINSIYYAIDNPRRPKSHDTGISMQVGQAPPGEGLLMIQGPLALNWKKRKFGIFPRIENGDISANNQPTTDRIDLWIKQRIRVKGDKRNIFVKVHTHGAKGNLEPLLSGYLDEMYSYLEDEYNDGEKYKLFYVTPYELYNKLKCIEKGNVSEE